jgi:hypothetical protein
MLSVAEYRASRPAVLPRAVVRRTSRLPYDYN